MRVNFRQGIINYQLPSFLKINRTSIDLVVNNTPLLFTIASGIKDYLFIENNQVNNAWPSMIVNTDQWIYIDYDARTAIRTFGITRFPPVISAYASMSPLTDQHWFDTVNNKMKVWNGIRWEAKIRIVLAKIQQGTIPISISQLSPIFSGTQIGVNTPILAGTILFNNQTGSPLTDNSGDFITTEDELRTVTTTTSAVKFANTLITATANQTIPAFTFVTFSTFGYIVNATAYTAAEDVPYGIIVNDVVTGDIINVTMDGIISSDGWDWSMVDVNTRLYCDNNGALSITPVIPEQVYSALVIGRNTILLTTPRQIHNGGTTVLSPMTSTVAGIARLSTTANIPSDPIVVGDNDPRLTSFLPLIGGHMSGTLILNSDPVYAFDAATKQYVDNSLYTTLASLTDVHFSTTPIIGQFLSYNGTKWVNVDNSAVSSLPDIIVAGNGTKVTFNSKGLITATTTLSASDIPTLPWSILSNTPNSITGYGISDAYTKMVSDGRYLPIAQNLTLTGDIAATGSINGSIATTLNTVPISKGGTGNITASAAVNALLPVQTTNATKSLVTDGINVSWSDAAIHPATISTLGSIIVGPGLSIDPSGVLSAVVASETISSGNFTIVGDCVAHELVLYGISTSASPINLLFGGLTKLVLSDNSSWGYDITVVGTRTDGTIDNGTWRFSGNIHRAVGAATTTITLNPYDIVVSMSDPNWTAVVTANTITGSLDITVSGVASSNIRWAAFVKTIEIKY